MRVAVLSDIHANVQGLEAVMTDAVNQNCEYVYCLGDLALAGPQPKEVMDYVMAQTAWTVIQGNTDKMIATFGPEVVEFLEAQYPVMANAIESDVEILTDEYKAYLANLPPQLSIEIEGVPVLMVHGSPRANNEDILPGMPIEDIEEIIAGTTEKLILCGHTHIPCGYQTNSGQTVVNVGSVGRPMTEDPKACYCIIDFNDGSFEVRHRFVPYDNHLAARLMSQRDFVGADRLSDLLLSPTQRHI
ncbi:MAG: metallophosphoesterase family protein [Cyanobacteriota bacterium]|nr:metallophosphoesterase family protein [Cyanobacteriota bacterium]MDY6358491.1 metallophosphoesterase family protein [Cyanobacteriota bacterium]MDY6382916.1 metallophosphoesterase family protein [Cyanobacteriota bacterium]